MPPRPPRGKGPRGSGRGHYRGHWMGHRGGGYRGGSRGGGHRGGRPDHYHGGREMHSPHRQHDPEKLLSSLAPETQLALTTAIINSVLKTDGREHRGSYHERDYRSHHRDARREGRGGYFREGSRERRHYGEDRRTHDPRPYHEEGRGHHYEREKSTSGSPRYRNNRYTGMPRRRPSPHGHPGPSRKRQRMERMDSLEGDSPPRHHPDYEGDEGSEQERERSRERKHHSPGHERERKGRDGEKSDEEKEDGPDGSSGVQVTIRADGERAVNNEGRGRPRVAGRLFVELRCPHCPNQRSITFKEYKYHLGSEAHKSQLNRLARKHSVVLRKIRVQQRQEQRDIEAKWKEEQAEEFKSSVTRFCNTCKLAFKCLGGNIGEGISLHNNSKLHRMQKCYLHPRCSICRITFPSRMVYEYHISSISHLRERTATMDRMGSGHGSDDQDPEDDDDELDLANFMTLDAVGEDDEVGSEHEEITGGLDDEEAAKEAETRRKKSLEARYGRGNLLEDDEISVEADWDKEQLEEEEDEEENEALGCEYVTRIEAFFCSLCSKIIRANTAVGSRVVQRHCRSFDHVTHYQDAHPLPLEEELENADKEDGDEVDAEKEDSKDKVNAEVDEAEGEMEEDPEQEKLWEEADKSLDMLPDEMMTEIDESCNVGESKEYSKDYEDETESNEPDVASADEEEKDLDEEEDKLKEEEEITAEIEKKSSTDEHEELKASTDQFEEAAEESDEEK